MNSEHEQCRSDVAFETGRDYPCTLVTSNNSRVYGDFDDYSIMNYRYNSEKISPVISMQDQLAARLAYRGGPADAGGRLDIGRPSIKTIQGTTNMEALLAGALTTFKIQYYHFKDPSLVPARAQLTLVDVSSGRIQTLDNCTEWKGHGDDGTVTYMDKACTWQPPRQSTQYQVQFNQTVAIPMLNVSMAVGQIVNQTIQLNQLARANVQVKTASNASSIPFTIAGLLKHVPTGIKIQMNQNSCGMISGQVFGCQLVSDTEIPQTGPYSLRVVVFDGQQYAKLETFVFV